MKTRLNTRIASLLLAGSLLVGGLPVSGALAEGGVNCLGVGFQAALDSSLAPTDPGESYYLYVEFDKNVSYASQGRDEDFVASNLEKVRLCAADGTQVESASYKGASGPDDRRLIYIYLDEWLDPLADYQVVVDAGIVAANGTDVLAQGSVFPFKTNDKLANGWSVYQVAATVMAVAAVLCGAAVATVRRVRRTKR